MPAIIVKTCNRVIKYNDLLAQISIQIQAGHKKRKCKSTFVSAAHGVFETRGFLIFLQWNILIVYVALYLLFF